MAGREVDPLTAAEDAIALLKQVALHGEQAEDSAAAARLMQAAHLHGPQAAFEVLIRLGHWQADENLELRRCRVPVAFAPEVLAEAEQRGWWPEARRSRCWWGRHTYDFAPEARSRPRVSRDVARGLRTHERRAGQALLEDADVAVGSGTVAFPDRVDAPLASPSAVAHGPLVVASGRVGPRHAVAFCAPPLRRNQRSSAVPPMMQSRSSRPMSGRWQSSRSTSLW